MPSSSRAFFNPSRAVGLHHVQPQAKAFSKVSIRTPIDLS
jgi:hypothetical protein